MTDVRELRRQTPFVPPPRPPVRGDVGVVTAKLSRPEVPSSYVERLRLQQALDLAATGPVTLVVGGPGWGKTSLVASWAAQASPRRTIAWLTLDADDDEPRVFWAYVLAALRSSGAVGPDNPLATLVPVSDLSPETHRQIQLGLSQLSREVVLVLDDVSEVRSSDVQEQISRLFRHESPLRVVLVARVEPPLPLHRLRVSGELAELRVDELAFTSVEAAEMLARQGVGVDPGDVAHLLDRTDGWAAGLRLAAMFLRRPGSRPADFAGSDRAVTDYLLGEVVADQSPQTWQFLLRTSLVARVCADLAEALTGQGHGQLSLERLERDNAFVTALGPERHWYRYHPLLTDMLRRQLQLERPETISDLHERAARWFAANHQPVEAVRHAVAARNWLLAGTLVTNVAIPRALTTDRHALVAVLAQIPTAELGRSPELQLCAATVAMVEGRLGQIASHLARARELLDQQAEPADPSTLVALSLFESAAARVRGSAAGVVEATSMALETLDREGSAIPLAPELRAIALGNRGVGLLWLGETAAATRSLEAGLAATEAVDLELPRVNALGYLGLAAAVDGRLRQAADWADRSRALSEARGWATLPQAATAYLTEAIVSLQWNDLDEAEHQVARGLETQRIEAERATFLALTLTHVLVDVARGRLDAGRARLDEVLSSLDDELPALVRQLFSATRSELDLKAGHAGRVRSRLETIDPSVRSDAETVALARARLATGVAAGLDELLAPVADRPQNLQLAVQASVVRALAADRRRQDNDAFDALARAVADAEPENMLAPFLMAGTTRLPGLLRRLVLLRPDQSEFARSVLAIHGSALPGPSPDVTMVEQVSERERTVLRYLASMLSNAEIAEQMFLSPNTVKVHLRHVYRKLDVTSRRAAVRRARELHLLDDDADA